MEYIHLDRLKPLVKVGLFGSSSEIWDCDVKWQKGKKVLLRSGSGKGKTSAMAFIYGLRHDYSGVVRFDQTDTRSLSLSHWSDLRKASLSIVFQDLRLFRQLSALDNVLIKNAIHEAQSREEVVALFDAFGIKKLMDKPCATLSFGEQQRVAVIRALVQPFDFLLMDEPFSHLDRANIEAGRNMILEVCQQRNAGLVITSLGEDHGIDYDQILEV